MVQLAESDIPVGIQTSVFSGAELLPLLRSVTVTGMSDPPEVMVIVALEKLASLIEIDQYG